jgi:hypothetical protein
VAPVHEEVGRLVGPAVEVDDRPLRHPDDEGRGHPRAADLGPYAEGHVEQRRGRELVAADRVGGVEAHRPRSQAPVTFSARELPLRPGIAT